LFPDALPFPAESQGLTASDFVIIAHANVQIPTSGDWTIGVHSDDGFALRFVGWPFDSVNGTGTIDDDFPQYMGFLNTGTCNTRGILKGIPAGEYAIEFAGFQRTAAAGFEVYAAAGAFQDDSETDQWQLIGAPGGLNVVAPKIPLHLRSVAKAADRITIEFDTPEADSPHQLQVSDSLKPGSWQPISGATFEKTANGLRVSAGAMTGPAKFFRLVLHP
jgi:hypothetical protein